MTGQFPKIINCKVHGWEPWGLVCIHLLTERSNYWKAVEVCDGREIEADWMCPDCYYRDGQGDESVANNLMVVCMSHLRELLAKL